MNTVDTELSGVNTRFGGGFRTGWGVVGLRGVWRRVQSTELRVAGEKDRLSLPEDVVRVGFLARRGSLSAVWSVNYRSSYKNRGGTGTFRSWTGHDVVLDWAEPLGFERARLTAGVFNLTDTGLSVNTANPSQRGRADGSGLGAHLLPHPQHAALRGKGAGPPPVPRAAAPARGACGRRGAPSERSSVSSRPASAQTGVAVRVSGFPTNT